MGVLDPADDQRQRNDLTRIISQARQQAAPQPKNSLRGLLDYTEAARGFVKDRADWSKGLLGAAYELLTDRKKLEDALKRQPKAFSDESAARSQQMAQDFWNPAGLLGKIVYHGSPHKFDAFNAAKIGTGEGAQAYGHGIYLADSKKVAEEYKNLKPIVDPTDTGFIQARSAWAESKGDAKKALAYLDKQQAIVDGAKGFLVDKGAQSTADINRARELINSGAMQPGQLYKADLPDEWIPRMLDWDKPLSQQSDEVRSIIGKIMKDDSPLKSSMDHYTFTPEEMSGAAGRLIYDLMGGGGNRNFARSAAALREAGIPGIRYLDGGSRGAGQGSYNYVVFPGLEDQVKILERNGVPLGLLGGK